MTPPDFTLTVDLPAAPARLFDAWISGPGHAEMTGAPATSEPTVGGAFTAWDGYIEGTWTALDRPRRVVMAWRTSEFGDAPDAQVEVTFEPTETGARLTLTQSGSPADQADGYRQGWEDYYFTPMRSWLTG